jgi:general stress protein 26
MMSTETKGTIANLNNNDALEKLKNLAEKCRSCFFVTNLNNIPQNSRPMSLQEVNENGELIFISSTESDKNKEIAINNKVQLYFQNNADAEFLSVLGECVVSQSKEDIDRYWTDFAKAWFTGKEDPTVTILIIKPLNAYYWDNKSGKTISFIKMALSAFTPLQLDDDGIEGKLNIKN